MANAVQNAVLANRSSLILREKTIEAEVTKALKPLLAAWERTIREAVTKRGKNLTPAQLADALRRTSVLRDIQAVSQQYAAIVEKVVSRTIEGVYRGEVYRASAIASANPFDAKIVAGFGGVSRTAVLAASQSILPGRSVTTTFRTLGAGVVQQMRRDLSRAIADGWDLDTLSKKWASGVGAGRILNDARALARTAMMAASNEGQVFAWKSEGRYRQLRWNATFDARTCPYCGARHGKVYDIDNLPAIPAHLNCVLPETLVSTGRLVASFRAWYRGDVVTIRTADGRRLTVTPNHLVLTDRGFVPAHGLRPGDNLVCRAGEVFPGLGPDRDDRPAQAAEVFRAETVRGGLLPNRVPTSPVDFHGDAAGFDRDVHVVPANWLLRGDLEPAIGQEPLHLAVDVAPEPVDALAGLRDLDSVLLALRLSADGIGGGFREPSPLLGACPLHSLEHRLAPVSLPVPEPVKAADDQGAGDVESFRHLLHRYTGLVELDKVSVVDRQPYAGWVHDFSTESGAYVAGGIVTHNCRCVWVPVFRAESEKLLKKPSPYVRGGPGEQAGRTRSYEAWLKKQPKGVQLDALGSELKWDVWKSGDLSLVDLTKPDATTLTDEEVSAILRIP